jgi:hypothetical protein
MNRCGGRASCNHGAWRTRLPITLSNQLIHFTPAYIQKGSGVFVYRFPSHELSAPDQTKEEFVCDTGRTRQCELRDDDWTADIHRYD